MFFRKARLGTQLFVGFGIILVIVLAVAAGGFISLKRVERRVADSDQVKEMMNQVLQIRRYEKNYILRGDGASREEMQERLATLVQEAETAKAAFSDSRDREQMDAVMAETADYREAFAGYVSLTEQKNAAVEEMNGRAADALVAVETISADQSGRLSAARTETDEAVAELLGRAEMANRLIRILMEARQSEKEYIAANTGNSIWKRVVDDRIRKLITLAEELRARFRAEGEQSQIVQMIQSIQGYQEAFNRLDALTAAKQTLMMDVSVWSQTLIDDCQDLRDAQQEAVSGAIETFSQDPAGFLTVLQDSLSRLGDVIKVVQQFGMTRYNEREYLLTDGKAVWAELVVEEMAEIRELVLSLQERMADPDNLMIIDSMIAAIDGYESSFKSFRMLYDKQEEIINELNRKAEVAVDECEAVRQAQQTRLLGQREKLAEYVAGRMTDVDAAGRLRTLFGAARLDEKRYALTEEANWRESAEQKIQQALETAARLGNENGALIQAIEGYQAAFRTFVDLTAQQAAARDTMEESARHVLTVCDTVRTGQKAQMAADIRNADLILGGTAGAGVVVGLLLAGLISGGITRSLRKVIAGLKEGAYQVAGAADEISSASQSLAEGASQQAASLEETAASLEEMATMTRRNADHATQADRLMKESEQSVSRADTAMNTLTRSMGEIAEAAEQSSRIVKTIDEIAFQTNLLALNAAVEAARAGEAGAGFAVVADEVRNLAIRSAESAKSTAALIQQTREKVNQGAELVQGTYQTFSDVTTGVRKAGELVGEIAVASKEQAEGIDQINRAASEMDRVVQQVAANAEETASASEEMSGQAGEMRVHVESLVQMVGTRDGGKAPAPAARRPRPGKGGGERAATPSQLPAKPRPTPAKRSGKTEQKAENLVKPEDVIPFDSDFDDF